MNKMHFIYLLIFIYYRLESIDARDERVEIRMPNATTTEMDAYLCTSYKIQPGQNHIIKIEPIASQDMVHHMIIYGCDEPASLSDDSWGCSVHSNACNEIQTYLYAWGLNAPVLELPENISFNIGENTPFKYIVVNIHYLDTVTNDTSGAAITFREEPSFYKAGIMLMVTSDILIPPQTSRYSTDISCQYKGEPIQVFAVRVHAHKFGIVNSAYRFNNGSWTDLARISPQLPQAFYKLDEPVTIYEGDYLVGRCSYFNDLNITITVGHTHEDEMCNVYLMYYTASQNEVMQFCFGNRFDAISQQMPSESVKKPNMSRFLASNATSHHKMHHAS